MRKDGTNGGDDGVCGGRDGREVVVLVGCGSWLIGVVVSGCGGGGLGSCSALIGGSIGAVTAGCAMGAMVYGRSREYEDLTKYTSSIKKRASQWD